MKHLILFLVALLNLPLLLVTGVAHADSPTADEIVKNAIDYWRDKNSKIEASMLVHRSDWKRSMSLISWTKGTDRSLVRFTAPARDAGSASLTVDDTMWSFSPKVNKVIKIPPSMMSQSWMGSDFSYKDLAREDDIVDNYSHRIINIDSSAPLKIYEIESIPFEEAPIVWGKEILKIREDNIILEHNFFDQDLVLVKQLKATEIEMLGGKLFAKVVRMTQVDEPDKWTEVTHGEVDFETELNDRLFTLSNLRNPRS